MKGEKISLKKEDGSSLSHIMAGLGWKAAKQKTGIFGILEPKKNIDIDSSVILLDHNDSLYGMQAEHLIYYGNLRSQDGAIQHWGDNLVGGNGNTDDEEIMVNLSKLPAGVGKVVFLVNIYEADSRNQHFGMIQDAFIRIVDTDRDTEICRFNLSDNYEGMEGLVVAEVSREGNGWKFKALGEPVKKASNVGKFLQMYR